MSIKQTIIDTLKYWIYRIENDECTEDDIMQAKNVVSTGLDVKLNTTQIAKKYGVNTATVRQKIHRNYIPNKVKISENTVLIPNSDVEKLFNK